MFATLGRAARRKGLTAGLAALVATAGIGVAVAAPSEKPEERSASAIGVTEEIQTIVDDAGSGVTSQVDVPEPPPVIVPQEIEEVEDEPAPSASASTDVGAAGRSTTPAPPVDVTRFLPEGSGFDRELLEELLAGGAAGDDVAEGADDLADEVIARIQACVGDVVGQFGSGSGFGGSTEAGRSGFAAGGSADAGQSFATSIVDDVLPCVAGLVDDAISCVSGLVEEILATVMGMDFDEIAGLAGVIVAELMDCVGGTGTD